MDDRSRALADRLGAEVVAGRFDAVAPLLAPWLQSATTPAALRERCSAALGDLPPPVSWTVDENPSDLATLRQVGPYGPPSAAIPSEITEGNFRDWICLQFQPDPDNEEGFNVCYDLWVAVVEVEGAFLIGYLEPWEAT